MKKFLILAGLTLGLLASASVVSAQQQQPAPQGGQQGAEQQPFGRREGRQHRQMDGRGRKHERGMKALSRLDLTEAQQGQIRSIREATRQRTEASRTELGQLLQSRRSGGQLTEEQQARARQLATELRSNDQSVHQEILGVLTPEQRAQLEQWQQERKSRRHEMRERRGPMENKEQP